MTQADIIIIGGGAAGLMAAAAACQELTERQALTKSQNETVSQVGTGSKVGTGSQVETGSQDNSKPKIIVLERMPRPARKIMITGKGRCNLTNLKDWNEFSQHVHPKANFLRSAFYNLSPEGMMAYLENAGLELVVERGDRVFPASHHASDVIDTLVNTTQKAGAKILCNRNVTSIEKVVTINNSLTDTDTQPNQESNNNQESKNNQKSNNNQENQTNNQENQTNKESEINQYRIKCSDGAEYQCSKLIICTGGLSYPRTGSTGDGYKWAKELGHKMKPCFPSLTAIVPKGYKQDESDGDAKCHIARERSLSKFGEMLCGLQLKNIGLQLSVDGNVIADEFGDIDFTDGGLEGPIGFKLSRQCVNALINGSKAKIIIDLKPAVAPEQLEQRINALCKEKPQMRQLLMKLVPAQLADMILKFYPNINQHKLGHFLKTWTLDIAGYVGYERCVVTAGGVAQEDIISKTMESKICSGLYFAGEVLDIDADTGGYNLQAAFSTGWLAGQNAAKALNQ